MRAALAALFGAALVLLLIAPADRALAARPNFVVIQTDDQNAATVTARLRGQFGAFHRVMPNVVQQMLGKGTEFSNYYATSPVCSPSRASLLSGQYPWNNGISTNEGRHGGWSGWQRQSIIDHNLPVALKRAGYRTAHFGKFTNSYYDRLRNRVDPTVPPGWTRWFTTAYLPGTRFYGYQLNLNGFALGPVGNPAYRSEGPGIDPPACDVSRLASIWPLGPCHYLTDVVTAAAVRTIKREDQKPFYIQVDYQSPHGDVAAPRGPQPATRHLGTASQTPLPRPPSFNERNMRDKPAVVRRLTPRRMDRDGIRRLTSSYRRYLESLRAVDDGVGAIFRALRRSRNLRDTYVVVTSDHGLFLGEHRYDWGKFMPYEDSSSPFMAIRGPGVPRGAVSREVVGNIDVPTTIAKLAGANPDFKMDGRSLRRFWRDPYLRSTRPVAITINSQQFGRQASLSTGKSPVLRYRGFRVGPYKYIRYDRGGEELYDLAADPQELRNRVGSRRYRGVLAYMRLHLSQVTECRGAACRASLPPWPRPSRLG